MEKYILAVDSNINNYNRHSPDWIEHGITPMRVTSMQKGLEEVAKREFLFIGINGDVINYKPTLAIMRDITLSPICIFTSHYSFEEHIEAIQGGADYYVERQQDSEQTTRWNLVIIQKFFERESQQKKSPEFLSYENVFICPVHRKAFVMDQEIFLTRMEFDLLFLLMSDHKRVFTYEEIIKRVWGEDYFEIDKSALWNLVKRLRKKMNTPAYIKNVHDLGYAFIH